MVKKFNPITPGLRKVVLPSNDQLTREEGSRKTIAPTKSLLTKKNRTNGRNHHGRITCRHKGGGAKQAYRIIDFKRDKDGVDAKVASIEYDPNRSAFIALLHYCDGEKRYIIAPQDLKQGDVVKSGEDVPFKPGCSMVMKGMPLGSVIHNLEIYPSRGAKLVRSAGLSAQLLAKTPGYVTVKMPSGEVRILNEKCKATFGVVSNSEYSLRVDGKAGRSRWKGIRPTVRGTAMNPVDHPHGGGEGRHNGYIPQTPWGMQTKGFKTRSKKKTTKWIVKDRRKK
ncbi:MAG: 50S ribosomal protein L2 [Simkaniaceae bacterium]|nr:50S ribosomal protein L2 [Simkaniaceae bacterium]